tara:strand:+ start:250 stop:897 length:648 start_codon:yes stop_codon:yes gene_type:complete
MGLFNVFVAYKFIKILVQPFQKTDAYKLGLIDKNGLALKKKSDFTSKEKGAYSNVHELIWKIKKFLNKVPGLKSRLGSFAVALWLLKQKMSPEYSKDVAEHVETKMVDFISEETGLDLDGFIMESLVADEIPQTGLFKICDEALCELISEETNTVSDGDLFHYDGGKPVGIGIGLDIYEMFHLISGNKYPVVMNSMIHYDMINDTNKDSIHETSL